MKKLSQTPSAIRRRLQRATEPYSEKRARYLKKKIAVINYGMMNCGPISRKSPWFKSELKKLNAAKKELKQVLKGQ